MSTAHGSGEAAAAVVIPGYATAAGAATVEALEDADDIQAARTAMAEPGPTIPLADVLAAYADDLAAYSDIERR